MLGLIFSTHPVIKSPKYQHHTSKTSPKAKNSSFKHKTSVLTVAV